MTPLERQLCVQQARLDRLESLFRELGELIGRVSTASLYVEGPVRWHPTEDMADLMRIIQEEMQISKELICGPSRVGRVVRARQAFMYLAHRLGLGTKSDIGRAVQRDHGTVDHAIDHVPAYMAEKAYRAQIERCEAKFKERAK